VHGPSCAIKTVIGDLGTYAEIRTGADAGALDGDGRATTAGIDKASIMGGNHPGAGTTLTLPI
jgi:hypothetical protein